MRNCRTERISSFLLAASLTLFMLAGCGDASGSTVVSLGLPTATPSGVTTSPTNTPATISTPTPAVPTTLSEAATVAAALTLTTAPATATTVQATPTATALAKASPTATKPAPRLLFVPRSKTTLLEWAQQLAQNVKPAGTDYQHEPSLVTWEGQSGATSYTSRTDCSGFINALFTQTYGLTGRDFKGWMKDSRPLAETFETNISAQNGFIRIDNINQAQPGDLLAIKYPPGTKDVGDDTGHIVLLRDVPQARTPTAPIIKGTLQWDVPVIDSAQSGHGKEDTRRKADGTFRAGLGEGTFRVYTDAQGKLEGYSWSDFADSLYYDQNTRPFTIGRLDPAYKLVS